MKTITHLFSFFIYSEDTLLCDTKKPRNQFIFAFHLFLQYQHNHSLVTFDGSLPAYHLCSTAHVISMKRLETYFSSSSCCKMAWFRAKAKEARNNGHLKLCFWVGNNSLLSHGCQTLYFSDLQVFHVWQYQWKT